MKAIFRLLIIFFYSKPQDIQYFSEWMTLSKQGRLLSAHARESKERFCFTTFVHALRERAVFGAAEFDNRTFEGESFFIMSSVNHLKLVTVKSNSKWREKCPFISLTLIFRAIKFFSCTPVIDKVGDFKDNKDEAKQTLTNFCSTLKSTTGLIQRQPKGTGYFGK